MASARYSRRQPPKSLAHPSQEIGVAQVRQHTVPELRVGEEGQPVEDGVLLVAGSVKGARWPRGGS